MPPEGHLPNFNLHSQKVVWKLILSIELTPLNFPWNSRHQLISNLTIHCHSNSFSQIRTESTLLNFPWNSRHRFRLTSLLHSFNWDEFTKCPNSKFTKQIEVTKNARKKIYGINLKSKSTGKLNSPNSPKIKFATELNPQKIPEIKSTEVIQFTKSLEIKITGQITFTEFARNQIREMNRIPQKA